MRIATRVSFEATLTADMQAIVTAVNSDTNLSTKVAADVRKFVADHTTCLNTMLTDLNKIQTDRTQLSADLKAMESSVP